MERLNEMTAPSASRRPEKPDPPHLPRRLGVSGERRGEEEAGRQDAEKESAVHYWMTSSARISSDCGMVSPKDLAVLRLMTSSYWLGDSTGRVAGLVPRRILST